MLGLRKAKHLSIRLRSSELVSGCRLGICGQVLPEAAMYILERGGPTLRDDQRAHNVD